MTLHTRFLTGPASVVAIDWRTMRRLSRRNRKVETPYDKALYRQRHHIENMLGRLKDWSRIATRYDRCAHTFFSAICLAATVTFWLD